MTIKNSLISFVSNIANLVIHHNIIPRRCFIAIFAQRGKVEFVSRSGCYGGANHWALQRLKERFGNRLRIFNLQNSNIFPFHQGNNFTQLPCLQQF